MSIPFHSLLNSRQLEAVTTHEGPLLILAGAGSGKTRVITYRIASLLERGIPQSRILAVTFTNKASVEMRTRIRELTRKRLKDLTVCTFHALGLKIIKEHYKKAGYRRGLSIYDQGDSQSLIKELSVDLGMRQDTLDFMFLSGLFSKIKTGRASFETSFSQYEPLYREYQEHLKLYNALDFDDLIVVPIRLFREFPDVLDHYREKYRYYMVDEFQDTSDIQYHFITLLASASGNLCVVGDDDQSIYSFRGAHYENLLRLEEDFPGLKEIKLEQNYRSTATILSAANSIISHNRSRKPKKLWSGNTGGDPVTLYFPETEKEEGEFIAREIRSLAIKKRINYRDVGILVRTNHLTRSIEEGLLAHNVPYIVSGGISFFNRKEVKDIVSYLKVLANPDDDINLLRIINTPRRGIGRQALFSLMDMAGDQSVSLYSALSLVGNTASSPQFSKKVKNEIGEFVAMIEHYRETIFKPRHIAKTVSALVGAINYWGYLLHQYKKETTARYKYLNVENLVNSVAEYEEDPDNMDPNLFDYLNRITLMSMDDNKDKENTDKVNLMTVHAAKGLEFDAVFIAAMEEELFPHARSLEDEGGTLEEERRLFYVALTRARKNLYLSSASSRRRHGSLKSSRPSPFLEELPEALTTVRMSEEIVEKDRASEYFSNIRNKFS